MFDLPAMKSVLPDNLNPSRFRKELDVYVDEYAKGYGISSARDSFFVENKLPLTVWLWEGINGEDLYERSCILRLLKIAHGIYGDTGRWPELDTHWDDMCPGGTIQLNVTTLLSPDLSKPLPELVQLLSTRLVRVLESSSNSFAESERHYEQVLKGLGCFSNEMKTIQRQFDAEPVCAMNVNTKARRLRYVATLASCAQATPDARRLGAALLAWAGSHSHTLQSHKDPKGAVIPESGPRSVKPYLDLAKELSVLRPVGRGLALTNTGRVLPLLRTSPDSFSLSLGECLFFLFDIAERDRDIISPLLALLSQGGSQTKRDIRKTFPEKYGEYLTRLRDHCGIARSRRKVDLAIERVANWRNAAVYMEHVVDPRLSWFVDLGLCGFSDDVVTLTKEGGILAKTFSDIDLDHLFVPTREYLQQSYLKELAPYGTVARLKKRDVNPELLGWIRSCCESVRLHTSSLVAGRIVASTLFRYTGITLYTEKRVALDYADMLWLFSDAERSANIGWELRWSAAHGDGYLTPVTPVKTG